MKNQTQLFYFTKVSKINAKKLCIVALFVMNTITSCQHKNNDPINIPQKGTVTSIEKNNESEWISKIEFNYLIINQIKSSNLITNSFNENKKVILKLIPQENIVIYRYSEYTCIACVEEDLKLFANFSKISKKFKVYVLVDYINSRENDIRFKYELEDFDHFRLEKSQLISPSGIDERYFATIVDGNISNIFSY